jgi:entericidin B
LAGAKAALGKQGFKICARKSRLPLALLVLIGVAPMGACQTVAGAGEDISAGGRAVTNSAEKHAP